MHVSYHSLSIYIYTYIYIYCDIVYLISLAALQSAGVHYRHPRTQGRHSAAQPTPFIEGAQKREPNASSKSQLMVKRLNKFNPLKMFD